MEQPAQRGLLSVIVPVGRDPEGLRRTLASLRAAQVPAGGFEIIVGNDGGDAETSAIAASYGAQVVSLTPSGGSYAARNAALGRAQGKLIAFLDADAMVDPAWMREGIAALAEADYACGPVIVPRHMATSPGRICDWLNAFPMERYLRDARFAPTANLFVRRTLIERLGPFDTRLNSGGDVEFGRRVHGAGLRQAYWPKAAVFHPPRTYREQLSKVLRVSRGQRDLRRYHRALVPELALSLGAMLRNLLPPRRLIFLNRTLADWGPAPAHLKPLLFLMLWSFKLQRLRAQLECLVGQAGDGARKLREAEPIASAAPLAVSREVSPTP
jgi:glycosyltransferase AglI